MSTFSTYIYICVYMYVYMYIDNRYEGDRGINMCVHMA